MLNNIFIKHNNKNIITLKKKMLCASNSNKDFIYSLQNKSHFIFNELMLNEFLNSKQLKFQNTKNDSESQIKGNYIFILI
jgi:hypothetical protein